MTDIVLINQSRHLTDADVQKAAGALATQVGRDFRPYWGLTAAIHPPGSGAAGAFPFYLQDGLDDPDALGYHVDEQGMVSARIDIDAAINSGVNPWSVVSHEVLETVADPLTTRMAPGALSNYIVEVCDPVEETGYLIDGITVSNFVLPSYYRWPRWETFPYFDRNRQLKGPCPSMLPGGYLMSVENGSWVSHVARLPDGSLSYMSTRARGRSVWRARQAP